MDNPETTPQTQRVALPAYLLQRLSAFRVGQVDHQTYVVRDRLHGKNYDFEPWQFFVLEVLSSCDRVEELSSVFEDRFGYPLPEEDVFKLFAEVADAGLWSEDAQRHPLLVRFTQRRYEEEQGKPRLKSFRDLAVVEAPPKTEAESSHSEKSTIRGAEKVDADEVLPPGVQDALDLDPRRTKRVLGFDPRPFLRLVVPLLRSFHFLVYLLPLPLVAAVYTTLKHGELMFQDAQLLLVETNVFQHLLFSLLTVNLCAVCATALVAHRYRANVGRFGLGLVLGFIPRFSLRVSHVKQLSRHERIWLNAAPLLTRMMLFSAGVLAWKMSRGSNLLVAQGGLMLASIAAMGLALSANPLSKGSGYQLLSAYANEANLRGKSYKILLRRMRGQAFQEFDEVLFSVYAMATVLFAFALITVVVLVLGVGLHRIHLGGSAFIVMGTVGFVLTRRALRYFDGVQRAYERQEQFERWRKRALPAEPETQERRRPTVASYLWRAIPLCLFPVLFLPYPYSPGGAFSVTPSLQQVIATDRSGLIEEVRYEGGEVLPKGTIIARLASFDEQAKLEMVEAEIAEQKAVIADLKVQPRYQHVEFARRELQTAQTRADFAKVQLERVKKLHEQGVVPEEELDEVRSEYRIRTDQIEEKRAELLVAQVGPTKEQIAAEEAKLQGLFAERDAYAEQIARSHFSMPFDGRLLTLNLKQKGNSFYERGERFAAAEMSGSLTAEIEVPESEMEYVQKGSKVVLRPHSQSFTPLVGTVETIDWNVTDTPFGNVVKVMAKIEDEPLALRNGMSGYAKIEGPELPVWQAFSMALTRFFAVEVWSWIP